MSVRTFSTATGVRFAAAVVFTVLVPPRAGRAQQTPAVPAPAPVAPAPVIGAPPAALPATPAPPPQSDLAARIARDRVSGNAFQNGLQYWNLLANPDSDVRVSPDLRNVSVREAARRLAEQSKREIIVDPDVPENARVSLSAQNVQLTTVLDLISQSAGVRWGRSVNGDVQHSGAGRARTTYRLGKTVVPLIVGNIRTLPALRLSPGDNTTENHSLNASKKFSVLGSVTQTPYGLVYSSSQNETRSTFTCPHCKRQATVIRKAETPKCPQCERVFQANWQFCPYDGTRRPASESAWKNCPFCGKAVSGVALAPGREDAVGSLQGLQVGPLHFDHGFGDTGKAPDLLARPNASVLP